MGDESNVPLHPADSLTKCAEKTHRQETLSAHGDERVTRLPFRRTPVEAGEQKVFTAGHEVGQILLFISVRFATGVNHFSGRFVNSKVARQ
jgi:hypothetical protein